VKLKKVIYVFLILFVGTHLECKIKEEENKRKTRKKKKTRAFSKEGTPEDKIVTEEKK
jgi:hypothetical protein